jgi:hypothetical protein
MSERGPWKKLLEHLRKFAPKALDVAGDLVGGPAGMGLEALARLVAAASPDADLDTVAEVIRANPDLMVTMEELAIQREKLVTELELARLAANTERQRLVAETMKAEYQTEDPFVRRWRPFMGWVVGSSFGLQMLGVTVAIFLPSGPEIIAALVGLSTLWAPAMAVLGVTSWTRGAEKKARLGS